MRSFLTLLSVVVLMLAVTACGGGDGDGGTLSPPPPAVGGGETLPGATVQVQSTSAVTPGATATFRISVSGAITDIAVFVGPTWEDAVAAQLVALTADTWEAHAVLPASLEPGSAVLVRLSFADGSIVETSTTAFPL